MCHTKSKSSLNSQNPQLNILTDDELCQTFIDHHAAGKHEAARPYLAELIERYDKLDNNEPNGGYFAALKVLAQRLVQDDLQP